MVTNEIRTAASQTKAFIKSQISQSSAPNAVLQPVRIRINGHPAHPLASLRQSHSQHRYFVTRANIRSFWSSPNIYSAGRHVRSSFPVSKIGKAIARRGVTPFASILRPNLTCGALPRSVGGYSLGGTGTRHFSHTPGIQAQVVQNVNAGIRAFLVNGGRARFNGFDSQRGEKQFTAVSKVQDEILQKIEAPFATSVKSTNLEFQLSPTITALSTTFSPQFSNEANSKLLNTPSLLHNLSTDFARALTDLSTVLTDLKSLATLGEIPISLVNTSSGPILTLRFPGCDAGAVSRLCEEVGVRRGVIREDEEWNQDRDVEMALLFPFAPIGHQDASEGGSYSEHRSIVLPEQLDWRHMVSPVEEILPTSDHASSDTTFSLPLGTHIPSSREPLSSSPSGPESLCDGDFVSDDEGDAYTPAADLSSTWSRSRGSCNDYDGIEGIYRFLRECESARK